jgi:hypothetical protein
MGAFSGACGVAGVLLGFALLAGAIYFRFFGRSMDGGIWLRVAASVGIAGSVWGSAKPLAKLVLRWRQRFLGLVSTE